MMILDPTHSEKRKLRLERRLSIETFKVKESVGDQKGFDDIS